MIDNNYYNNRLKQHTVLITWAYSRARTHTHTHTHTHTQTHTHTHKHSDPNDVIAPPQQYTLINHSYTLNCSLLIADSFISWLHNGADVPSTIPSVQLSDEGLYVCRVSINGASLEKPVQFGVIGKILLSHTMLTLIFFT